MSDKNMVMVALVAVGAVLMLNKAGAANLPAGSKSAAQPATNVQNQLWSNLLGDGWRAIASAKNADGTAAFLKRDFFGNVTTTDGRNVGGDLQEVAAITYGNLAPVDIAAPQDEIDYTKILGGYGWN